jgi:Fe-S-cluster containining protein
MARQPAHERPRSEAFAYECGRCRRCCQSYLIQVDPYEIARLARRFGQTTAEFRRERTEDGAGNHLKRHADGSCVFLEPEGCTVYEDRPLVCRIYPLGRHVDADGVEHWSHLTPHPETKGRYSRSGTIGDYLTTQGAEPFMRATDLYTRWVRRAIALLGAPHADAAEDSAVDPETNSGREAREEVYELIDMDSAIALHCTGADLSEPVELEDRMSMHLQILDRRLDAISGGNDG